MMKLIEKSRLSTIRLNTFRIMETKGRNILEPLLREEPTGHRQREGTTGIILSLRRIVGKALELNIYTVFLNIMRVLNPMRWNCLEKESSFKVRLKRAAVISVSHRPGPQDNK